MSLKKFALIPVVAFGVFVAQARAQSKTITGTVTDAMCGKTHMMKGESAAQCTRECVKRGSDYELVRGDSVYTLKGDKTQFDKFAGTSVVIEGVTTGTTVTVKSIKAAQ